MSSDLTLNRANFLPGNDVGNVTAETQMPDGRGNPLKLILLSNGVLKNKGFRARLGGRVQTSTNTTFTVALYFGISSTIGNNTQLLTSGAQSINNTKSNWEIWLEGFWDSDSQSITGWVAGQVGNNIIGPSTLENTLLSADPNRDSNPSLQSGSFYGFTVTGLFGGSSSGNHAFVDIFDLEAV